YNSYSQLVIFSENFGNTGHFRAPANTYNDYSSDKSYFSSDSIAIHNWNTEVSDYSGASAQSFALCGYPDNNVVNIIQIGPVNTSEYVNIHLSFGVATWYGTASDYMEISYSMDGSNWTLMDDSQISTGQYGSASWGYVTLSEVLPSTETLYIKFQGISTEQALRFDDIKLEGSPLDTNPPTSPVDLTLIDKDYNSIALSWEESSDNNGVDHYNVFVNGIYNQTVPEASSIIKYLNAGDSYEVTVTAVDAGGNSSAQSEALFVSLEQMPSDFEYSWQKSHATVMPEGDLAWAPEAFVFEAGGSLRYIDYENGDDNNDGLSTSTPWKHHPWDKQATGNAASESGIHTYIFKRGVEYRGVLTANESGKPGNPIRLTSDPSWGTGEAAFLGSFQITDGWQKSNATISPKIPEPEKVWYKDISLPETNMLVEVSGDEKKRVRIARTPNYQYMPEDPVAYWPVMTFKTYSENANVLVLGDKINFTQENEDYYEGGTIWSQEDAIVMCTVWGQKILDYNPQQQTITVRNENFGGVGSHYFIEDTPYLLDTTSEFYYDNEVNRLFVRLEGDSNPNNTTLEYATKAELIKIDGQQYIDITGLSFGFTSYSSIRYGYGDVRSVIRMNGSCNNINIRNNDFYYINGGISAKSPGSEELRSRDITVSDNDFHIVDDLAMVFEGSDNVYLENINILRNKIFDNGGRQRGRWYSSIPAIWGQMISGEAAGNIVEYSWGNGLDFFWGKGGSGNRNIPFIRGFIHHNKAAHTLLGTNDYGGIESWQGGPLFCYNNISHNAYGYKHYNNSSIGEAFYFDGAFKHIVFNNISSGKSQDKNNTSFMQVLGYYNMYVHNTGYNTEKLFASGSGALRSNGHNIYLSNVGDNVKYHFYHMIYEDYVPFESYAYNISATTEFSGSLLDKSNQMNLMEFRDRLEEYQSQKTQTGWNAAAAVLENPGSFDFRPRIEGEAIDRGVQFFTAFPLSRVVGEWNFYKHPADTTVLMGENFYMTDELNSRTDYHNVPKNHLKVHKLNDTTYRRGVLEDWTEGALYFDGSTTYCSLSHADASAYKTNNVDLGSSDLIMEVYFKTEVDHVGGALISKSDGINGYELGIDNSGNAVVKIISNSSVASMTGSTSVNTGNWHHLLAEVDRNGSISIYLDGRKDNGSLSGSVPANDVEISNPNDLLIGKNSDDQFFNGTIDFLRISKATLSDARTTVHELHTWLTEGPYKYDFAGNEAIGKRDAGAIEAGLKNCSLSVSENRLEFQITEETQVIEVNAEDGFSIYSTTGDFFTTSVEANEVSVSVGSNDRYQSNAGELVLFGCNESVTVQILQEGAPCMLESEMDTLFFNHNESTLRLKVEANAPLQARRNASFFTVFTVAGGDSIEVSVKDNNMGTDRAGKIILSACNETLEIPVIQSGDPNSTLNSLPEGMEVYPNPVDEDILYIRIPQTIEESEIVISDLSGKNVYNKRVTEGFHSLELDLNPGIYMLRISNKDLDVQSKLIIL
ncbi:MAG: LamG-like jellyroll fold domain-containing protein, partial [bacterium]